MGNLDYSVMYIPIFPHLKLFSVYKVSNALLLWETNDLSRNSGESVQ